MEPSRKPDLIVAVRRFMYKLMHITAWDEPMVYRRELFAELLVVAGKTKFQGERVLEIGPKDGLDSMRLASLEPRELVLVDLPEKRAGVDGWLHEIACPHRYVEANIMYMSADEFSALGRFQTGLVHGGAVPQCGTIALCEEDVSLAAAGRVFGVGKCHTAATVVSAAG